MSDSLWPHGLQHTRLPCQWLTPRPCSNSCSSSQWCHPTLSSSVVPFWVVKHLIFSSIWMEMITSFTVFLKFSETSPTLWTWVGISSGSWWWTGKPGVLQFMGSQRVRHNWVIELNWTEYKCVHHYDDVNMKYQFSAQYNPHSFSFSMVMTPFTFIHLFHQ